MAKRTLSGPIVRPGQIWQDADQRKEIPREIIIKEIDYQRGYANCISTEGRRTRIRLSRLRPTSSGYVLIHESPAKYIDIPSEEESCVCEHQMKFHVEELGACKICKAGKCPQFRWKSYRVWTGDMFSPAHCPCEFFRWAERQPGEPFYCKHLKLVLEGKGMI